MAEKQLKIKGVGNIDGKLQLITSVDVMLPTTIPGVHVNKLDDGKFRAIKGDIQATATKAEDALKGWRREYKKSLTAKRTKKKIVKESEKKAESPKASEEKK